MVASAEEAPASESARVFHGVPVDAWVASRKDSVNLNKVAPPAPANLRFFLQCMELKEGYANELKEKECRELAAKSHPRPAGFIN